MIITYRNPRSGSEVDTNDTTADYLNNKIVAGSGIAITIDNPGGVEALRISTLPTSAGITGSGSNGQLAQFTSASNISGVVENTAFNQNFETVAGNILINGVANAGISSNIPRADHVHPTDTSRQAVITNPITGTGVSGQVAQFNTTSGITSVAEKTAFNQDFETSTSNIKMDGSVSVGVLSTIARADHIHASDTTKQNTITNPITGLGTTGQLAQFTSSSNISGVSENTAFNKNFETSSTNIQMDGVVNVGSLATLPHADHVHPTDTSRQSLLTNPITGLGTSGYFAQFTSTSNISGIAENTAFNQNFETNTTNIHAVGAVSVGALSTIPRADHIHADNQSGWIPAGETWTYASAVAPNFTLTMSGDKTTKYSKDMKIQCQQLQTLSNYWKLTTENYLIDEEGNANGTVIGTPDFVSGLWSKNCLRLGHGNNPNTTDAISFADSAAFHPTSAFTFGCWFKTNAVGVYHVIFNSWSINPTNWAGILLGIDSSNVLRFRSAANTDTGASSTLLIGTTNVCDNVWHYAVWTLNNNWLQIYLDGKLELAGWVITPGYGANNYVRLGCGNDTTYPSSNAYWFTGQIQDVFFINNYALDENTIRNQYNLNAAQGAGNITVTKNFIVCANPSYSSGTGLTTITLYGGTDYTLTSGAITNSYYSMVAQPFGFDRNPNKWSVTLTNSLTYAISSLSAGAIIYAQTGAWGSACNIIVPIGNFKLQIQAHIEGFVGANPVIIGLGLSQSSSNFTDPDLVEEINCVGTPSYSGGGVINVQNDPTFYSVATTYYLVGFTALSLNYYYLIGIHPQTKIKAEYVGL
jgi:hypothetical protein